MKPRASAIGLVIGATAFIGIIVLVVSLVSAVFSAVEGKLSAATKAAGISASEPAAVKEYALVDRGHDQA